MIKRFKKINKRTGKTEIITYDDKKLYNYGINKISTRDYGRNELFNKMKQFQDDDDIINTVLNKLEEQNYLSDERRANSMFNMYVNQESIHKTIQRMLKIGISKDLIDNVIYKREQELNDDNEIDSEVKTGLNLIVKKYKYYDKENWQKMTRFLASKGYKFDTIKKVISLFSDNDIDLTEYH